MSYIDQVVKASGGAAAPAENLDEAALEKTSGDPCWDGYVQLGTKMKNGKEVPNCVPIDAASESVEDEFVDGEIDLEEEYEGTPLLSAATIEYLVDSANRGFGSSRHISYELAGDVASLASSKYEHLEDKEHYASTLREVQEFLEYAVNGDSTSDSSFSAFTHLLPAGHPATEFAAADRVQWIAGTSEITESAREAVVMAFSSDSNSSPELIHAKTRLQVLVASGQIPDTLVWDLYSASTESI